MSDGIPLDQLEVGKLYRVEMNDCCVQGWFVSRLTEILRDEDGDPDTLLFTTGKVGPDWGSWTITEEPEPPNAEDYTVLAAQLAAEVAARPTPWDAPTCTRCSSNDTSNLGGWFECRSCGHGWAA